MKPATADFTFSFTGTQIFDCDITSNIICGEDAFGTWVHIGIDGQGTAEWLQQDECTGSNDPADPTLCFNLAGVGSFMSTSDQAFIESDSKQLLEQTNKCIAGASCLNTGEPISNIFDQLNEFIRIEAEDQATVKSDTEQNTLQHNTCEGAFAECSSSGVHLIDILASDQAVVEADSKRAIGTRK